MATNKDAPATPEERKEKYWGKERNERRREQYQTDKQYRRSVLDRARKTQFDTRRAQGLEVREGENCRDNIGALLSADKRDVMLNGEVIAHAVRAVTVEELARLLDRDPQVLYRWMGKDMLPRPVFESFNERNRKQAVYTADEARAVMTVFSRHQETSLYFRESHRETIEQINHAVRVERQKMGVSDDANSPEAAAVH